MKIAFMADLHLSPFIWVNMKGIKGDAYRALEQATNQLIKAEINVLILGGDIFDNNAPTAESEKVFWTQMNRFKEKGITVMAIQGNHDYTGTIPRFEILGALDVNNKRVHLGENIYATGIEYTNDNDKLLERILALKDTEYDYVVMHTAFKHLLGFEGAYAVEASNFSEAKIKKVLVGDIHVKDKTTKHGITFYSPGATHVRSISEINKDHGIWIFDTKNGKEEYMKIKKGRDFVIENYSDELVDKLQKLEKPKEPDFLPVYIVQTAFKNKAEMEIVRDQVKDKAIVMIKAVHSLKNTHNLETLGDVYTLADAIDSVVDDNTIEKSVLKALVNKPEQADVYLDRLLKANNIEV